MLGGRRIALPPHRTGCCFPVDPRPHRAFGDVQVVTGVPMDTERRRCLGLPFRLPLPANVHNNACRLLLPGAERNHRPGAPEKRLRLHMHGVEPCVAARM